MQKELSPGCHLKRTGSIEIGRERAMIKLIVLAFFLLLFSMILPAARRRRQDKLYRDTQNQYSLDLELE